MSETATIETSEETKAAAATDAPAETKNSVADTKVAATDEGKKSETEKPKESSSVVPEKYDLKPPKDSQISAESLERIASFAKEQGLSNAQAQAVLESEHSVLTSYQQSQLSELAKQQEGWLKEWKSDPKIGGANYEKTAEITKRLALRFGGEPFVKALESSGLGNYPGLARLLVNVEEELKTMEDKSVRSNIPPAGPKKSVGEIMYPKMYQKK